MINVSKYKLQMVKETGSKYDIDKVILNPEQCYIAIKEIFGLDLAAEEYLVMLALDTKNRIIAAFTVSQGNLNTSIVHPREVFKRAILANACAFVLGHNHPSGYPTPSVEDIRITQRIYRCGEMLGIQLLDHIIIGDDSFKSLKETGDLQPRTINSPY